MNKLRVFSAQHKFDSRRLHQQPARLASGGLFARTVVDIESVDSLITGEVSTLYCLPFRRWRPLHAPAVYFCFHIARLRDADQISTSHSAILQHVTQPGATKSFKGEQNRTYYACDRG
jgi:hypothetical protein